MIDQIARLGVNTVEGLRSMIEAAPADVARFLGGEGFKAAQRALQDEPASERVHAFEPDAIRNSARIDLPSPSLHASIDIALRDRLFEELRALRERADHQAFSDRIEALEQQLNALLEDDVAG
jgi:hypothetical protein